MCEQKQQESAEKRDEEERKRQQEWEEKQERRKSGERFGYYTVGLVFAALWVLLRNEMRENGRSFDTALAAAESVGIVSLFLSGLAGLFWLRCNIEQSLMTKIFDTETKIFDTKMEKAIVKDLLLREGMVYTKMEKTIKDARQTGARLGHYWLMVVGFGLVSVARWLKGVQPEREEWWLWLCLWGSVVAVVVVTVAWSSLAAPKRWVHRERLKVKREAAGMKWRWWHGWL